MYQNAVGKGIASSPWQQAAFPQQGLQGMFGDLLTS